MVNSAVTDNGTIVSSSEGVDVTSQYVSMEIANEGITGTTLNKLASTTGAPATAILTGASATKGMIGIVVGGAGTTGSAQIAVAGIASCVFDASGSTANHYVVASATAGDCADGGTSVPTKQAIGIVTTTNAGTGTYAVILFGPGGPEGAGGGGGSGTVNNCATTGNISYYSAPGTVVDCVANVTASAGTLNLGTATSVQGHLTLSGSTSGTITVQGQAAAGTYNFNLPTTAGTSGQALLSGGGGANAETWNSPAGDLSGTFASTTVSKINGNSVPSGVANNQLLVGTAANTFSFETVPDCTTSGFALNFTQATNAFACVTAITNQVSNQLPLGNTANTLSSTIANGLTGQALISVNGGPPAFASPGLSGQAVTSTPYTILCDSGTALRDRKTTIQFQTGSSSVTIPDPSASGCGSSFTLYLVAEASITLNRTTTATFTIDDGVTRTTGATSLAMTAGQTALVSSPDNINYLIQLNGGNAAKINGTAVTGTNGNLVKFGASNTLADSTIVATAVTQTIASGTAAMPTSAIASGVCSAAVTVGGTGIATTDVITATFNGDPTGVTGYAPTVNGTLYIYAYPTANNANFKVCNNTSSSITPGAATLNWRVVR
jgi:hypothetical protein